MSNEHKLIKSIAAGDRKAFQQLYEIFAEKVYNTAISYVQAVEDAEEITQDVFTQVFKYAAKFKGDSAVNDEFKILILSILIFKNPLYVF